MVESATQGATALQERLRFEFNLTLHERATYRCKRLSACGGASEYDVRIVVLVYAEKTLKCWFVTKSAGKLKPE